MNLILALILIVLALLLGITLGHFSLMNAIQREGYYLQYDKNKPFGHGRWRIKRAAKLEDV